ncbi:MAG: hypothetical protein NTZ78_06945 [Candidatus Aureabacteria bacterium]|nr:hypothetical protein [Candidatus Auribacterota bacterium]
MSGKEATIKGHIHLFYCYELAYSVKVDKLEQLLRKQDTEGVLSMRRSQSLYLRFESFPLIVKLGEEQIPLLGSTTTVLVQARLFDFGVVSLSLVIPFSGTFHDLAGQSAVIAESDVFSALANRYLKKLKKLVAPALHRPIDSDLVEDYQIFHVSEIDEPLTGRGILEKYAPEITMILRAEKRPLSEQEVHNAVSDSISYYPEDLLVIDWDRAFLYDRDDYHDHIHIIEFANTQLLDMRYYDRWLDGELDTLYSNLEVEKTKIPFLRAARYRQLDKRTRLLMTDVLWVVDQIDNSLKAIDTLYAARVFRAIGRRLYLEEWKRGLDRKLAALRDISDAVSMKIYNLRSTILELTIVFLILFEIVMAFTKAR